VKSNEMREMTTQELHGVIAERQKDLVNFRLRTATGVVENVREARNKRRDIARIKTVLRERELAAAKGNQ
jgi:large subunit ribosomal protein L29